jgi:hypothetical protein
MEIEMSRTTRRIRPVSKHSRWDDAHAEARPENRDGSTTTPWPQMVKWRTNVKRRGYWRTKKHEILRHGHADVANMEKLYLGEVWNWD